MQQIGYKNETLAETQIICFYNKKRIQKMIKLILCYSLCQNEDYWTIQT